MKYCIYIINLLFLVNLAHAQSNFDQLEQWGSGVGNIYSCNIDYKLYKKDHPKVLEQLSGFYSKGANGAYFKVANTEFIQEKETSLIVNHDVFVILLKDQEKDSKLDQIDFGNYEKLAQSVNIINENNQSITFRIDYYDSLFMEIGAIDIKYNKAHKQPMMIKLYYKSKINFSKDPKVKDLGIPIIEISYSKFSDEVDSYLYNVSRFFEYLDADTAKLKSTYSEYELHNLKLQD